MVLLLDAEGRQEAQQDGGEVNDRDCLCFQPRSRVNSCCWCEKTPWRALVFHHSQVQKQDSMLCVGSAQLLSLATAKAKEEK